MEACVVICRTRKLAGRERKILFIDAVHEVARERAQSYLKPEHQKRIVAAYRAFTDEPGFARVATVSDVLENSGNLSIPRYVRPGGNETSGERGQDLKAEWTAFDMTGREFWQQMDALVDLLDEAVEEKADSA